MNSRILCSTSAKGSFVIEIRKLYGDEVAAGAYAAIIEAQFDINQSRGFPIKSIYGIIQAFLHDREIDWTAGKQVEQFNELRNKYSVAATEQEKRIKEIERLNEQLNSSFSESLKTRQVSLDALHKQQSDRFQQLVGKHEQELKALETTYDQKLALQKPVEYWAKKEKGHKRNSIWFGVTALISLLCSVVGMGYLVWWIFGNLSPTGDPKHWQLGILAVGAFFAIWLVRVFMKLFFSNLHLATDANERKTMILTFLAMSREGAPFTPLDKQLVLQHLFRSTADGYVKDDATPPLITEFIAGKLQKP